MRSATVGKPLDQLKRGARHSGSPAGRGSVPPRRPTARTVISIVARGVLGNDAEAEDVVQETYVRASRTHEDWARRACPRG